MLTQRTTSFELHAKMAEEIDLEKCNFRNFRSSVTLTLILDRVEVRLVCMSGRDLITHLIIEIGKKLFCERTDGRTYARTDGHSWVSVGLLDHRWAMT